MSWDLDEDIHQDTVTIIRTTEGGPDDDGIPTSTTVRQVHPDCSVQPESTTEPGTGIHVITSRWRVSGPLAQWIRAGDRAEVPWIVGADGRPLALAVDGRPASFASGPLQHTEYYLIERKG